MKENKREKGDTGWQNAMADLAADAEAALDESTSTSSMPGHTHGQSQSQSTEAANESACVPVVLDEPILVYLEDEAHSRKLAPK